MGARTLYYLLVTYWVVSSFFCFLPIFWRGEVNAVEPSADPDFGEQVATVCIFIESRNFIVNIQPHLLQRLDLLRLVTVLLLIFGIFITSEQL